MTKDFERGSRTRYDRRRHGSQRGGSPKKRSASSVFDVLGTHHSADAALAGTFGSRWVTSWRQSSGCPRVRPSLMLRTAPESWDDSRLRLTRDTRRQR